MSNGLFLGDQFFAWMMLAFGAALLFGNIAAMIKRPKNVGVTAPPKAPLRRTLPMIGIGLLITVWAFASIVVHS